MPGLFGVETPEEIRGRLGRTGREQDLNLAQLPAGRGQVALASQLGRGTAQGGARLLGAPTEPQKAQQKQAGIKQAIDKEASLRGITREKNPIQYLGLTSQVLAQAGETQAAANALKFTGEIDRLTNLEPTALEKEIRAIFNVPKGEKLPLNARERMNFLIEIKNTPSSSGLIPADKQVTRNDREKAKIDLKSFISSEQPLVLGEGKDKETFTSTKDFRDTKNREAFELALARENRFQFNSNKGRGKDALSETQVRNAAFDALKPFLKSVSNKFPLVGGDIPNTQNIVFDETAFKSAQDAKSLGSKVKELTDAVEQDVRSVNDLPNGR